MDEPPKLFGLNLQQRRIALVAVGVAAILTMGFLQARTDKKVDEAERQYRRVVTAAIEALPDLDAVPPRLQARTVERHLYEAEVLFGNEYLEDTDDPDLVGFRHRLPTDGPAKCVLVQFRYEVPHDIGIRVRSADFCP